MKVLLVIDHFGSGGAQKQIISLARGLKNKGIIVEFANYYPEIDFFRSEIEYFDIPIHDFYKKGAGFSFYVLFELRKLIKSGGYDAVIAYLDSPCLYTLLAAIFLDVKVIVSDRNSYLKTNSLILGLKRQFFRLSDSIVANSYSQANWLTKNVLLPAKKVHTIYNGYELCKIEELLLPSSLTNDLKLIGIGRINPQKNIEVLIDALSIFSERNGWCPIVSWVGRSDSIAYEEKIKNKLKQNAEVNKNWKWLGEKKNINILLSSHHAVVLPSLYEGLPNVICEAMLLGKIVLVSDVCDNSQLVGGGERGFLFNPTSPHSLVLCIESLVGSSEQFLSTMATRSREYAEDHLSLENMVDRYVALL